MPPAHITVEQLLSEEAVERIVRDETTCRTLLDQAERHVRTARGGLELGDTEGSFQLAYDACRKTCLALVQAVGLRPRNEPGSHVHTFEAAAAIADRFGQRRVVTEAARLRYVRHGAQYRADVIDRADANDALDIAAELIGCLGPRVAALLAEVAGDGER